MVTVELMEATVKHKVEMNDLRSGGKNREVTKRQESESLPTATILQLCQFRWLCVANAMAGTWADEWIAKIQ